MVNIKTSYRLIIFIVLSFLLQIILVVLKSRNLGMTTTVTKATSNAYFGFNIHSLPLLSDANIDQTLDMVSQCSNTSLVRLWGFSGGGDSYDSRMFNAVENLGNVLENAPSNMKFVVTLSNYYTSGVYQPWPAPEENPTRWFSSDWKMNRYKDFVNQVTSKYKGNSKIMIWEIMNEPNCDGSSECTEAQHQFIKDVSDLIAANDPGKMISAGNQAQNTGGEHFDNGEYEDIVKYNNISAASCHLYLENKDITVPNCIRALSIAKQHNKFFYIGELGFSIGCTAPDCTNTCSQDKLVQRKDAILNTARDFTDAGTQGIIVWQFSPERNSELTCDGASVFPQDPFCSIKNIKTLENDSNVKTDNTIKTQTNTGGGGFSFNPANPKPGDQLKITFTSSKGLAWVNLAVDGPDGEKINMAGKTPAISKDSKGYHWTYTVQNVKKGDYNFTFSHDCQKYNMKKGQALAAICANPVTGKITVGGNKNTTETKTNKTQVSKQNNNTQNAQIQNQTTINQQPNQSAVRISSPGKITLNISAINPVDPMALEYCQKFQTSNAGCVNPHDQVVDGDTVTMSFPDGNPLIFCGSIPVDKRNKVNGSDRACFMVQQKT